MKLTGNERTQLWLGVSVLAVGCMLQIAQVYVFGAVLTLAGFAICYPAQRALREKLAFGSPARPLPRASRTWGLAALGLLLLTIIGASLAPRGLPPAKAAWAFMLVVIVGGALTYGALKVASHSAKRHD